MTHGNDTHMERRQGQSHSRGRAILLAALMGLIGCVSSTETWRLIGSTKYQEFKAPPPGRTTLQSAAQPGRPASPPGLVSFQTTGLPRPVTGWPQYTALRPPISRRSYSLVTGNNRSSPGWRTRPVPLRHAPIEIADGHPVVVLSHAIAIADALVQRQPSARRGR
jgi:hypothetical protein